MNQKYYMSEFGYLWLSVDNVVLPTMVHMTEYSTSSMLEGKQKNFKFYYSKESWKHIERDRILNEWLKTNRREAFQKLVAIGKLNSIKLTYFLETEKDFKSSLCKTQITKSFKYPQGHVKFTSCFPFVREPNRRNRSTSLQSRRNEVNIRFGEVKWRQISKLKNVDDTDMREVVFPFGPFSLAFIKQIVTR